ncbi:MAG: hypothetical protein PWR13_948, partial [Archaeoglobi archaeon]|nr:hypothetical protein [Archaeoglobi archaeon]
MKEMKEKRISFLELHIFINEMHHQGFAEKGISQNSGEKILSG